MKSFQFIFLAISGYLVFCFGGAGLSGCTKTNTVYDTTIVIIKDTVTLTVKDTVTISDTVLSKITKGMIAYYNFNGGNLNDSSGNSNNIVFSNATPTADRFGNPNNAFLFDGSSSYMQIKNSASLNPNNITMYAIVKPMGYYQGTCHGNSILQKGYPDDINGLYFLRFAPPNNGAASACSSMPDTTKENFYGVYGDNIPLGSNAIASGTSSSDSVNVQKNQWFTIAYSYDGTTARFYVNGALVSSVPNTGAITFTPNALDLLIGKAGDSQFPYYFKGVIDEIRIYNRTLTNEEVNYLDILRSKYLKVKTTRQVIL